MPQESERLDPLGERPDRPAAEVGSAAFWDGRYQTGEMPWDGGAPAPPLVRAVEAALAGRLAASVGVRLHVDARVAVLGAGRGHDALALAERGLEVQGFDFAPEACVLASAEAAARGLTDRARFEVQDIFQLDTVYHGAFDLVVEHTCYCAIHPSRRPDYVTLAAQLLVPGGRLVALFFPVHADWRGGPPYRVTETEIDEQFHRHFAILAKETPADSWERRQGLERLVWLEKRPVHEAPMAERV